MSMQNLTNVILKGNQIYRRYLGRLLLPLPELINTMVNSLPFLTTGMKTKNMW